MMFYPTSYRQSKINRDGEWKGPSENAYVVDFESNLICFCEAQSFLNVSIRRLTFFLDNNDFIRKMFCLRYQERMTHSDADMYHK